jgi:hypothetical protein
VAPELARDYCIELLAGSKWVEAVAVTDNRHRHCVHKFKPQRASAVRLTVTAAGCGQARVYEVRIYGKGKS